METPSLKAHLFICTSCTYKDQNGTESNPEIAMNLRKEVKNQAVAKHGKQNVRVSSVGCLGTCDHGISAVLYPHNEWHLGLRPEDAPKLIEIIDSKMTP